MDWIIHLDTDELIHPAGAQEYSLRRLLSDVPENVNMVIFPNYVSVLQLLYNHCIKFGHGNVLSDVVVLIQESSIERDNIKDPFTEVNIAFTWILPI
jgi:hypothetical protein